MSVNIFIKINSLDRLESETSGGRNLSQQLIKRLIYVYHGQATICLLLLLLLGFFLGGGYGLSSGWLKTRKLHAAAYTSNMGLLRLLGRVRNPINARSKTCYCYNEF
jgi:hypothetical protein